jgi:3-methyladenine DNA glycosylase AlkD
MQSKASEIQLFLQSLADPGRASVSQRFFKTGKDEYGENDIFLGITIPTLRLYVKKYRHIPLDDIQVLLKSKFHEERIFALFLLVDAFKKGSPQEKTAVYSLYINNTRYVNNWDLVDCSAHLIVGAYLEDKDRKPLYVMAQSKSLWERRIAIISTFHMIRKNNFKDALLISAVLKNDTVDLIQKAVGWMLREIGKRDKAAEVSFLIKHYKSMPRTMLRYAIEKFPENERKSYLHGTVS